MKIEQYKYIYEYELNGFWYRVRRSMIHYFIKKYFPLRENITILDLGCGMGALTKELMVYGDVYGLDFSSESIKFCKERGLNNVFQGDATNIPFDDQKFDIVLSLDVLEHIQDHDKAVKEVKRVLKQNGLFIAFVPAFMSLWSVNDDLSEHKRRYTKRELNNVIINNGFTVKRSSYFNTVLFIPIFLIRKFNNIFKIKVKSEIKMIPKWTDKILYSLFYFESLVLRYINLPFGVSLFSISNKNK
jgi:ubiquinone/menaquinone biosynthesis C-methylase UbiE